VTDTRRIAIIPVFNEERTLDAVLTQVEGLVDLLILVDDGSRDGSPAILREHRLRRPGIWVCSHRRNRGMAPALKTGFFVAQRLLASGVIAPGDILVNLDADGQHPVEELPAAAARMLAEDLDVLLVERDFSLYPRYKVLGNRLLSALARVVSGYPYRDVESGFRFLRARCLPRLLPFFTGWKYSCAQEIAIITALLGMRIRNDFPVRIHYYRPGTTALDGFAVLVMSFFSWLRVRAGWRAGADRAERHLAGVRIETSATAAASA
jgi:glycosyltransferase involved in cell wall biosynthesis